MADIANLKRLFTYCYRILKESRNTGELLFDIRGDGHNFVDLSLFFEDESLLSKESRSLLVRRNLVKSRTQTLGEAEEAGTEGLPQKEAEIQRGYQRLLGIYDQILNNPYELDLVYAYLFVVGTDLQGSPVCAPLYLVNVSLQYNESDGALKIECLSDEARVNHYALAALVPDSEQIIIDGLNSTPYLHLPATLKEVNGHLTRLAELQSAIQVGPLSGTDLQSPFDTWAPPLPKGRFALRNTGALALVRKSNVYLLRDLEKLQTIPEEQLHESVVARFAVGDDADQSGETFAARTDDLILPFPSSDAQRKIARAALKHRMVLVQGPPGTGKSHTISNLVCHLIAQGKSVLVTSQKNKALEVVDQKLQSLNLENFQITLLKDDRESKRRVKQVVEDLIGRFSGTDPRRFAQAAEKSTADLYAGRKVLTRLLEEFAASRRFETLKSPGVEYCNGQVSALYSGLRGFDWVSQLDDVAWEDQAKVRDLLLKSAQLHAELKTDLHEVARFHRDEAPPSAAESDALAADLLQIEKHLKDELTAGRRTDTQQFLTLHAEFKLTDPAGLEKIEGQIRKAAGEIQELHESAGRVLDPSTGQPLYLSLLKEFKTTLTDQAQIDLKKLGDVSDGLKVFEAFEEQSKDLNVDGFDKESLRELLVTYRDKKSSFLRFLSGAYRKARKDILRICRSTTPQVTETHEQLIEARLKAEDLADRMNRMVRDELGHLVLPERRAFGKPSEAAGFRSSLEQRIRFVQVLSDLHSIETQLHTLGLPNVQLDRIGEPAYFTEVHTLLMKLVAALRSVISRLQADVLITQWGLRKRGPAFQALADAWEKEDSDNFRALRAPISKFLGLLKTYSKLVDLEKANPGLAHTFAALRSEPGRSEAILTDLDRVVKAAALRTLIRKLDKTAPRTTSQVSADVRACEDYLLELMAKATAARLDAERASNLSIKAINNTVSHFAKVLQRSAKNYKAFEELKVETDFSALLKVLPCWIAGISDVSRIFPLVDGLFDYAIVDEASQCFLPSSIPLLYRARQVIVVGDDQQLPNAEAGYISKEFSKALMTELGLNVLPRSASFDATENSLYDVIFSFKDRSIFLDEHFRCNPEIIRFSNSRFYNNRLKIATESMSRSLGRTLELVRVEAAADDPDRKVNAREAEFLVEHLQSLLADPAYADQSIGVCSLFREQADYIARVVSKKIPLSRRLHHQIIVSTADGFQGDERDVILYSFRYAPNSSKHLFTFMQTADGQKRANVAFTRSRKQIFCFASAPPSEFPTGIVRDYLTYVADPGSVALDVMPWDGEFETAIQNALERLGLKLFPRYASCGFRIDLVAWDGRRKPLAIECDGWEYHADEDGQVREEDIYRQSVLERAGWTVVRISSREFYRDPAAALSPIAKYFGIHERPAPRLQPTVNP